MYKFILFDLDGTLADTSEGIYGAYHYACEQMGIFMDNHSLDGVIGGNLLQIFINRFGLNELDAKKTIAFYRNWYEKKGISQVKLYPDMKEVVSSLADKYILGVATLKREDFAKRILSFLDIEKYFYVICGMDKDDSLSKEAIILNCMKTANATPFDTLLIGDSESDLNGAEACNIYFMPVTYGFGFDSKTVFRGQRIIGRVNQPNDLLKVL